MFEDETLTVGKTSSHVAFASHDIEFTFNPNWPADLSSLASFKGMDGNALVTHDHVYGR